MAESRTLSHAKSKHQIYWCFVLLGTHTSNGFVGVFILLGTCKVVRLEGILLVSLSSLLLVLGAIEVLPYTKTSNLAWKKLRELCESLDSPRKVRDVRLVSRKCDKISTRPRDIMTSLPFGWFLHS